MLNDSFFEMKSSSLLLLAGCFLGTVAAKTSQNDTNEHAPDYDGKILIHQVCNSGKDNAEISSLKKAVERLKERLDKNEAKGKGTIC